MWPLTSVWGPRQWLLGSWTSKPAVTEAAVGDAGWCWEAHSAHTGMGLAAGYPTMAPHTQILGTPWPVSTPEGVYQSLEDQCCSLRILGDVGLKTLTLANLVMTPIVYSRAQLLVPCNTVVQPEEWPNIPHEPKRIERGCRAGAESRNRRGIYWPALPSLTIGNVRSLNKLA